MPPLCGSAMGALLVALCSVVAHTFHADAVDTSAFLRSSGLDMTPASTADDTLVITPTSDLKTLFVCSQLHPIGYYNEYFVTCGLRATPPPWRRIQLQGVRIHGSDVYDDASNVHVELELVLNASAAAGTSIEMTNSVLHGSAVRMEASSVVVDTNSSINTTASGLKFGPGYNSWFNMGSSYGGVGGAALSGVLLRRKCEDLPSNNFFRAIGSVAGDVGNFQGYGSGGGHEKGRGGGRIEIRALDTFLFNGSLVANGGEAATGSSDSGGSGGTVQVTAGHVAGLGSIQVNGGEPALYDESRGTGGGGGGGGGRIAMSYKKLDELNATQLQAYGGGVMKKADSEAGSFQWCQLGADGSILKTEVGDASVDNQNWQEAPPLIASLVIKGRRVERGVPSKPVQLFGCTTLFYETSRGDLFVPPYVAHLFVTGGATLCVSYMVLQPNVSTTNSSIVVEPGSTIDTLDRNHSVTIGATHVSLQSYIGPASQTMRDAFHFSLTGGDVALANAQLLVDRVVVNAISSIVIDKFSAVKFRSLASFATSSGDVQVLGFLQPDGEDDSSGQRTSYGENPLVRATATQNILFKPQAAQIGAISIELHAGLDAEVDLPFETPFLVFFAEAFNLVVVRVSGGSIRECKAVESLASTATCANLGISFRSEESTPYLVSLKAASTLTLGNVTAGSILACSDGLMSVEGRVTADGLGCSANSGPGASSVVSGASGGAGHGGKGGNVEPGNTGGGKSYDFPPSQIWPDATVHKFSLSNGPPAWPVWPGSGAAAGDGSGGISGGNGGGLVYIGVRQLTFSKDPATISARGAVGTKNGGGGAGGSIAVFVGEIIGNGILDASGGDSQGAALLLNADQHDRSVWEPSWTLGDGKSGGGGGAGGIIRTYFRGDQPGTSGDGDAFVKNGGKVVMDGGKGAGGENGGAGIFMAVNCSLGRGGGLCESCEPGAFSPGDQPRCLPCEPGSYSDKPGLGSCLKCAAGSYNRDFGQKSCEQCAAGSSTTKTGATTCAPCAPGSFADKPGSASCLLCPNGSISITSGATNCTLCGIGETTQKPGSLHCEQCRGKPDHSVYNVRGKCTYACEKGRTGLDCLTPFERFVKPIGGPLGFAILVLSFIALVLGSWVFLTFRTNADQKFRQRFAQYKAQTQRDEQSLTNLTKNLTPRLTDHDLTSHVTRLYFSGDNHLFSGWVLDPFGMPSELKELVRDEDGFASFATSCNELVAWPESGGWECWVHRVLLLLLPPFATVFLRKRQLHRVERLAKHATQYTGGFVRELGFRRHGAQLKVGFSPDFSLAYFDVIAPSGSYGVATTPSPARLRVPDKEASKPVVVLEMTIAVAGSGSFFRPYHIDTNDALVRAVPARLELLQHQFWIDFVAEMNQRLRLLQQPSASRPRQERIAQKLQKILEFVDSFNRKRTENADGIRVRFGTLESTSQFTILETASLMARLEAFPLEPFKFALLVTKPATSHESIPTLSSLSGLDITRDSDSTVLAGISDTPLDSDDPRPIEFRYSSIRMEALFDQPSPVGADDPQQPLHLNKLGRRNSRHTVTVSDLLLCTPNSATFHWLAAVLRPVAPVFRLRNLRPRTIKWPFITPLAMLVLLIGDCIAIFWVLMEFYCVQVDDPTAHDSGCSRVAFASVLSVLPLAITGAPLLGLISLVKKSVFYGKLFAVWTLGSVVNLVVAFGCGIVYFNYVRESVLLVIAAWLVLKVLEKEMALQCIAQYTVERPLRGWRGLHTTKDWYDAAYTPLIHHER